MAMIENEQVNPETAEPLGRVEPADPVEKKKRTRKAASPSSSTPGKKPSKRNRERWTDGIMAAHEIAALHLKAPELRVSAGEAEKLADATCDILDYYAIEIDPVKAMWANFAVTALMIYAPRVVDISRRVAMEKRERAPVVQMQTQQRQNVSRGTDAQHTFGGMPIQ